MKRTMAMTHGGIIARMRRNPRELLVVVMLSLAIACIYIQVSSFDFIFLDDGSYVKYNHLIKQGLALDSIKWAFTETYASNWHPLTWISHMADIELFGLQPGMHHLTNVFFHTMNTLLLFILLRTCTGALWKSTCVAALFAVHPLHVESVAWISERKDVLSTMFWMLTLLTYAWYVKGPSTKKYLLAVVLFAAGLLAKPMLVTLPFVLLLFDYWPLKRVGTGQLPSNSILNPDRTSYGRASLGLILLEKIPFFILSAGSSIVTFIVQKNGGAVNTLESVPVHLRIINSLVSYVTYLWKMIWPVDLAVFYPLDRSIGWDLALGSLLVILLITVAAIFTLRRFSYVAVGWFWYLGTLVPVIGFVQVGGQSMADRYTYVPLIGIFIIITWGLGDVLRNFRYGELTHRVAFSLVFAALMGLSWFQAALWKDNITLFDHALQVTKDNYLAHHNFGCALYEKGRFQDAIEQYAEAIRIYPSYALAHSNMAIALEKQGKRKDALDHYYIALKLSPRSAQTHYAIGKGIFTLGNDIEQAVPEFRKAVVLNPRYVEAWYYLGICLTTQGKFEEGKMCYMRSLKINPEFTPARLNLAKLLESQRNA